MSQWLEAAGLIAGSGAAGSLITKFLGRDKDRAEVTNISADTAGVFVDAAVKLIVPLQAEITALTTRVGTLESENTATKTKLQLAIDHIRALRSWISTHISDKTPPQPPSALGL